MSKPSRDAGGVGRMGGPLWASFVELERDRFISPNLPHKLSIPNT